jgi:arsenite-transporting ATPase
VEALSDAASTTVVLVARPDVSALREAARAGNELRALGIANQRLVVNGLLTGEIGDDLLAAAFAAQQRDALALMPAALGVLPRTTIPLIANDLTGLDALRLFSRAADGAVDITDIASAASVRETPMVPRGFGTLDTLVAQLAADGHGVVMTMGKGGVGKTSLAASIAIALANAGHRVHLSTTDPAAHIAAALGDHAMSSLTVSRIDPTVETALYAQEVLSAADAGRRGVWRSRAG